MIVNFSHGQATISIAMIHFCWTIQEDLIQQIFLNIAKLSCFNLAAVLLNFLGDQFLPCRSSDRFTPVCTILGIRNVWTSYSTSFLCISANRYCCQIPLLGGFRWSTRTWTKRVLAVVVAERRRCKMKETPIWKSNAGSELDPKKWVTEGIIQFYHRSGLWQPNCSRQSASGWCSVADWANPRAGAGGMCKAGARRARLEA